MWRHRNGGGSHQAYHGRDRFSLERRVPIIARGLDVAAIAEVLMQNFMGADGKPKSIELLRTTMEIEQDVGEENTKLAKLPSEPDEALK